MRLLLAALFLLATASAVGQGCSQCRETVGQTPAATQKAYRRGIAVLMIAGVAVFSGGLYAVRQYGK